MAACKPFKRALRICCLVTSLVLLLLLLVAVILFFTVLKLKQPKIQPHPVLVERIELELVPLLKLHLTLGLVVTIRNPNYAKFDYESSVVSISYHDEPVGEAPIDAGVIPSRGSADINTTVVIQAEKVLLSKHFWPDVGAGSLNFTPESDVRGKASLLFMKIHAKSVTTCDLSVFIDGLFATSTCKNKITI